MACYWLHKSYLGKLYDYWKVVKLKVKQVLYPLILYPPKYMYMYMYMYMYAGMNINTLGPINLELAVANRLGWFHNFWSRFDYSKTKIGCESELVPRDSKKNIKIIK